MERNPGSSDPPRDRLGHSESSGGDDRFRLLVEAVQDYAIFLLDAEGWVTTWNAGAERIQGYSAEEIIGRHFSIFSLPNDVERGTPTLQLRAAPTRGGSRTRAGASARMGRASGRMW